MNTFSTDRAAIDARLAPAALTAWATTILAIVGGSVVAFLVAGLATLAAVVVWRFPNYRKTPDDRKNLAAFRRVVAVALMFGATCAIAGGFSAQSIESHPLRDVAPHESVTVVADVRTDPQLLRNQHFGQPRHVLRAHIVSVTQTDHTVTASGAITVIATGEHWADLLPGQRISFTATTREPRRKDFTVATLFTTGTPDTVRVPQRAQRIAGHVRSSFKEVVHRTLPASTAAILPGIVIGDRAEMSEDTRSAFVTTSLTHLTVVSGTHVTIVCAAVLLSTRFITGSRRLSVLLTAIALVWFVIICRPEPSVLRAAAMGTVTLIALLSGRRRHALPALCAAVIVLLVVRPQLAVDLGFALSVTATAGLVLATPPLTNALTRRGVPDGLAAIIAVSTAAHFATAPIIAGVLGQFSVVAVLANLVVAPVVTAVIILGYLGLVLAPLSATLAAVPIWLAGHPTSWILATAQWCAALPNASIEVPRGIPGAVLMVIVTLAASALIWAKRWRLLVLVVAVSVAAGWAVARVAFSATIPTGWVVAACDVGQGDMFVHATGPQSAIVIDVGPAPDLADSCLRTLGINTVDLVIITHFHADHVAGLSGVFTGRNVGAVAIGPGQDPQSGFDDVVATAQKTGVPIMEIRLGDEVDLPATTLRILGPNPDLAPYLSPNDQSVVVSATTRVEENESMTLLFCGDIEFEAQQWLLDHAPEALTADIMTVPHHGAATTLPQFLHAVAPEIAIISAGRDNTYGHPHTEVLDALESMNAHVARTDVHGLITVRPTSHGVQIVGEYANVPLS
ncbi:DNA internalization-related competence protein ComEC/Rec2 [Hoyosella rhizosphaerae]|uniref:Competence protein ComEC n=1 Tax=Hoyosella rhizosphaerae TaxID=1755582 RepID=A0A916UIG6_9ACTN|nr:DNA internalization-related competence protein ComEC/Rec2 [Hoyosella rhizosphaerae]MBN4928069.1 DNA internalization-related competence protein ComEC/Rec2 [Hoyosella rhizosphaerae]GGC72148.1 competence protein ComEC [Hoyosella rhizosphaerae]